MIINWKGKKMPSRTKTTKPKKVSRVGQSVLSSSNSSSENNWAYPLTNYKYKDTTYNTGSFSCGGNCDNCQNNCQWDKNNPLIPLVWVDDKTGGYPSPNVIIDTYIKRFKDKPTKKNKEKLKSIIEEENNLKKQKQEIQKQEKELINKTKMLEKKEKELNAKEIKLKEERDILKKEKEKTQKLQKELYQGKELADILEI